MIKIALWLFSLRKKGVKMRCEFFAIKIFLQSAVVDETISFHRMSQIAGTQVLFIYLFILPTIMQTTPFWPIIWLQVILTHQNGNCLVQGLAAINLRVREACRDVDTCSHNSRSTNSASTIILLHPPIKFILFHSQAPHEASLTRTLAGWQSVMALLWWLIALQFASEDWSTPSYSFPTTSLPFFFFFFWSFLFPNSKNNNLSIIQC